MKSDGPPKIVTMRLDLGMSLSEKDSWKYEESTDRQALAASGHRDRECNSWTRMYWMSACKAGRLSYPSTFHQKIDM